MEQKTNLIDTEKRERINAAPVVGLPRSIHLIPMDIIAGFEVRPGFYEKPNEDFLLSSAFKFLAQS